MSPIRGGIFSKTNASLIFGKHCDHLLTRTRTKFLSGDTDKKLRAGPDTINFAEVYASIKVSFLK